MATRTQMGPAWDTISMFNSPHVSIVAGASSGIGVATAILLAESGSSAAVHYNRDAKGAACVLSRIEELGGKGFVVQADLRNRRDAQTLAERVIEEFGQVDVLVNNA